MRTLTNKDVMAALEACIETRWKVRAKLGDGVDVPVCQLCQLEFLSGDCCGCPVFEYGAQVRDVNMRGCCNTPFIAWGVSVTDKGAQEASQREVNFLVDVYEHFFGPYPHGKHSK